MGDRISRPSYYCEDRLIEPIEVIEDWSLNYHLGSAIKYISRAGRKLYGFSQFEDDAILSEIEDLKKAIWYMQRRIKRLHVQLQEVIQFEVEHDELVKRKQDSTESSKDEAKCCDNICPKCFP